MMKNSAQLDLFSQITSAYVDAPSGTLSNADLYAIVAARAEISDAELHAKRHLGENGPLFKPATRRIRWFQQTLKHLKVIERVPGERGIWRLTEPAGRDLDRALPDVKLVAFSTDLGVAVWARGESVIPHLQEMITLYFSSTPYPLRTPRAYGNPDESAFVDFACKAIEPVVANLVPGGSIVLNLSNDIFMSKSPARSTYLEELVLALRKRLGLWLMERLPWVNYSKPPGPTYWACVQRVQLTSAYEPIYWFTNDPTRVIADNRRVLQAHSERHMALMQAGGAQRTAVYGDGAYRLRPESFGRVTEGKIPRNVIERGHNCADTRAYREHAKRLGLPIHGAMQPTDIPEFFIKLLTRPGDLVVDSFGGTIRTGLAAERLGRRWLVTEWMLQYIRGAAELFRDANGFSMHPGLMSVGSNR